MASSNKTGEATTKAVVAYAARLRSQAVMARIKDPHVELYSPSEDTARKLSSQLGPQGALNKLAERARAAEVRYEEEEARAQEGRDRLRAVQLVVVAAEREGREQLTLGQRLDAAMLGLRMQSDVSAASVDADVVSVGRPSSGLPQSRRDRQRDDAIADAERAVERLERELDRSRRRLVERAA